MNGTKRNETPELMQPIPHAGELQVIRQQVTPDDLILAGIKNKMPIAEMRELYALKREFEKDQAEKAYVADMAEFKRNPPEILKKTLVDFELKNSSQRTTYMHADLGEVCEKIVAGLAAHGFSHDWEIVQEAGQIEVTCVITHLLGHSKRFPMPRVQPDQSGGKNAIQGVASAMTYMQRYSLLAATGLTAKGIDNDGRGAGGNAEDPEYSDETLAKVSEFNAAILESIDETELRRVGGDIAGAGLPAKLQRGVRDRYTSRLVALRKAEKARIEAEDAAIAAARAGEA